MSTMRDSRQFIAREGREAVLSVCGGREKEGEGPKAVPQELYRGTARALVSGTCAKIWLGCFLAILVSYSSFVYHSLAAYLVEVSIVFIFLVISAFLKAMKHECDRRELMHRAMEIIDIYETESSTCEADSKDGERENVEGAKNERSGINLGSTWASLVLAYRDETWQRLPEVLLIEGDIIALICGDIAPGRLRPLSWSEKKNDWIDIDVEIPKGKKILQEWSDEGFHVQNTCFLQATSPELLRLFGDVKCYRIQDTPLLDYLTNIMSESESKREQGMRTLLRERLSIMFHFALYLAGLFALLTFVAGVIRFAFQLDGALSQWSTFWIYNPAMSVLCFLPIPAPIFLILGEALMTAHILLYFGEPTKNPSKYATNRQASRGNARTDSTSPHRTTSMPSMYSHEYDELDVRERIAARQKMHSSVPMKLELYQTWRVLCTWVSRSLNHKAPTAAVQSDDVSAAENPRMAIPIPLRRTCLVDRLGSVTSFCVLDEEVACKPYSIVEEVFILNPMKRTDALTTPHGCSLPYSVLDLHTGEDRDPNSDIVVGSKFEDAQWWTRLSSLKPIGFTCLVAEGQGAARLRSTFHTTNCEMHSQDFSKQSHVYGCPEAKLIECSQQLPSFRALHHLSREMGFTEHDDMSNFLRVHKIGIIHPRLGARSTEDDTPRAVGLDESWLRGIFNPHVRSYVVQDRRTGSLHCMSEGRPPLLLGMCVDYWDGTSISAIPANLRSMTVEVYRKWTQEDFDVTAFSCAPVPYTLTDLLCGRDTICPPDYLVYPTNAPTSPVGRRQNGLKHDSVSSSSFYLSSEPSHKYHEPFLGGSLSTLSPKKSCNSDTSLPKHCYSEINLTHMHVLAAHEAARTSSLRLHDDLWETLHGQVFIGMVASSSCPVKAIPCLIEDLLALGVRFLYFSPRNMRRTKAIAEKMGMFTDWNCGISLRALDEPNIPDPNRMTSTCDWDVNARLPHGTAAIREHIKEVDNVPLLVPLFTDSTPETILEMIDILKEYNETVLCIGTCYRLANAPAFETADLTVVREALPAGREDSTLPLYSERRLSLLDMQFCQHILSLCAALPLGASPSTEKIDDRLSNLADTIHEGSRVLHNIYQAFVFVAITSTSLGLIPVLSMIFPVTVPVQITTVHSLWSQLFIIPTLGLSLLYTPHINTSIFHRMPDKLPEKHSPDISKNSSRYIIQALICAFILSFGVIAFGAFRFGTLVQLDDTTLAGECTGRYSIDRINLLLCPNWSDDFNNAGLVKSRILASDEMMTLLVIGWIFCSGFLHYRVSSPFQIPPWRNRVWVVAVCIVVCLQAVFFFSYTALKKSLSLACEGIPRLSCLIYTILWVFILCGTLEIFRKMNAKGYNRSQTLLRLEFDTRLGMHSPR